MQIHIAKYGRYVALSAVIASTVAVTASTGGFRTLARIGDAALEFYGQTISDWGQHLAEKLDPTYPRCFRPF
jgi:hypothetical protein